MGIFDTGPVFAGPLGAGASGMTAHPNAWVQNNQLMAQAQQYTPPPSYYAREQPVAQKIRAAISRMSNEIPFNVARKIHEIRFGPEGVVDPQFEVLFVGGKILEFPDIDTFPTGADIARLCLECP